MPEAERILREERGFSTAPEARVPLTAERLAWLEANERRMHASLVARLDREAEVVALVGRAGSDLSTLRFAGETPRFTHVALAVREDGEWWVHHLLNTHGGKHGHLYRQPLIDFFRDDPFAYRVSLVAPSSALQHAIAGVLRSPLRQTLFTPHYSRIAYPFSTRYMNSNQWVAEIVGAARGGGETRADVQRFLAASGLEPSLLLGIGPVAQLYSRFASRNTRLDDHPPRERLRGRFAFLLEPSLRRYLCAVDAVRACEVLEPS